MNPVTVVKLSLGTYRMMMVCVFRLNAEALIRPDSHRPQQEFCQKMLD